MQEFHIYMFWNVYVYIKVFGMFENIFIQYYKYSAVALFLIYTHGYIVKLQ